MILDFVSCLQKLGRAIGKTLVLSGIGVTLLPMRFF